MLVGARHPGASVGMVENEYRDEVQKFHSSFQFSIQNCCLVLITYIFRCRDSSKNLQQLLLQKKD